MQLTEDPVNHVLEKKMTLLTGFDERGNRAIAAVFVGRAESFTDFVAVVFQRRDGTHHLEVLSSSFHSSS